MGENSGDTAGHALSNAGGEDIDVEAAALLVVETTEQLNKIFEGKAKAPAWH